MDFLIREGKSSDIKDVYNLINLYADKKNTTVKYTVEELIENGFTENPVYKIFVAVKNNEIIGFLIFNKSYGLNGRILFVEDTYVKKEFRDIGIGTALVAKFIEYAFKNDIEYIKFTAELLSDTSFEFCEIADVKLYEKRTVYEIDKKIISHFANQDININEGVFNIRFLKNRDIPGVLELIDELLMDNKQTNKLNAYNLLKNGISEDRWFKMIVAELDEKIISFILFIDYFSTFHGKAIHIKTTFTSKEFQNLGIRRILYYKLIQYANENNYNRITQEVKPYDIKMSSHLNYFNSTLLDGSKTAKIDINSLRKLINS